MCLELRILVYWYKEIYNCIVYFNLMLENLFVIVGIFFIGLIFGDLNKGKINLWMKRLKFLNVKSLCFVLNIKVIWCLGIK